MRGHRSLNDARDIRERASRGQELGHRDLVCRVHNGRHRASNLARFKRQGEAAEGAEIRLLEIERTHVREVHRSDRRVPALGVAHRVLDRYAHVRRAEVRFDRAVGELDHRVDAGLRVDDYPNRVVPHAEEMVRLDGLESFVHKRRRVDGDLGTHRPRRMSQRFLHRHGLEFSARPASEGSARCGQPYPRHLGTLLAEHALEDGRVLAVHRNEVVAGNELRHQLAADHERLLVRQRETLAGAESRDGRAQSRGAHERVEYEVAIGVLGKLDDRLRTRSHLGVGQQPRQSVGGGLVGKRQAAHPEGARLLRDRVRGRAGGQRHHLDALGEARGDLNGLSADRTGRAEDGDADGSHRRATSPPSKRAGSR